MKTTRQILTEAAKAKMNDKEKRFFDLWYFVNIEYPAQQAMDNVSSSLAEIFHTEKKDFLKLQRELICSEEYSGKTIHSFPIRKGAGYEVEIKEILEHETI